MKSAHGLAYLMSKPFLVATMSLLVYTRNDTACIDGVPHPDRFRMQSALSHCCVRGWSGIADMTHTSIVDSIHLVDSGLVHLSVTQNFVDILIANLKSLINSFVE